MHISQKDTQIAWILSKKLWPTVQYFIAGLQAKDVLFQESIFVAELLEGFRQPRAPR
jgi:hypothetical protein